MVIVRRMSQLTIYHNPRCTTSRRAKEIVDGSGIHSEVVEYLKTPLDADQLHDLIRKLEDPVEDLVRKDAHFKSLDLKPEDHTGADAVVRLLTEHPRLMQRPVLVRDDRAIIGRPLDRVAPFVTGS